MSAKEGGDPFRRRDSLPRTPPRESSQENASESSGREGKRGREESPRGTTDTIVKRNKASGGRVKDLGLEKDMIMQKQKVLEEELRRIQSREEDRQAGIQSEASEDTDKDQGYEKRREEIKVALYREKAKGKNKEEEEKEASQESKTKDRGDKRVSKIKEAGGNYRRKVEEIKDAIGVILSSTSRESGGK